MPDLRLDPDNHLWRQVDYRWAPRLGPNGRCSRRLCTVFTLPEAAQISPGAVLQLPHFIYSAQNLPHKIPSPRASSPYYQSSLSFSITLKLTICRAQTLRFTVLPGKGGKKPQTYQALRPAPTGNSFRTKCG